MDASVRRNHHHYHHYHHHCHFVCHLRHRHFICHHSPALPIPPPLRPAPGPQIPDPVTSILARRGGGLNSEALRPDGAHHGGSSAAQMWQGQEYDEQMEEYSDYDEEPIFVLTDEWREFFEKSEARRKQEKKQAKRKAKK